MKITYDELEHDLERCLDIAETEDVIVEMDNGKSVVFISEQKYNELKSSRIKMILLYTFRYFEVANNGRRLIWEHGVTRYYLMMRL